MLENEELTPEQEYANILELTADEEVYQFALKKFHKIQLAIDEVICNLSDGYIEQYEANLRISILLGKCNEISREIKSKL